MELPYKLTGVVSEKQTRKMLELTKTVQNMNDKFNKQIDSMRRCQIETPEIKDSIGFIKIRNDKCEDRFSEIEEKMEIHDDLLRKTLIIDQEKFIK